MKLETPKTTLVCAVVSVIGCLAIVTSAAFNYLKSGTANKDRTAKLDLVAKYHLKENCLTTGDTSLIKIGQLFAVDGDGKIPTACISNGKQYAYVAYSGGELKAIYVYTDNELKSQLSIIKESLR